VPDGGIGIETFTLFVLDDDLLEAAHQGHLVLIEMEIGTEIERVELVADEERRIVKREVGRGSEGGGERSRFVAAGVLIAANELDGSGNEPIRWRKGHPPRGGVSFGQFEISGEGEVVLIDADPGGKQVPERRILSNELVAIRGAFACEVVAWDASRVAAVEIVNVVKMPAGPHDGLACRFNERPTEVEGEEAVALNAGNVRTRIA